MVQQQKTPTLRFKEFDDEWNNFKIGDIFSVTRGQVLAVNQIKEHKDDDNSYPVYSSQTKNDGLLGYYDKYLFDTAITWTTDGANAGTVSFRNGKFFSTNVNGVLLSKNGFANKTVAEALNNVAWRYVSRIGNPKLMNNVMAEIMLSLPSFPEQSAIGSLFQTLDELLSAYKDNLANYQAFKATMLSKMFPKAGQTTPEIRLDGFDGEWEVNTLNNLATFSKGNGYTKGDLSENGQPIILYGQLYTNYQTVISESATFVAKIKDNSVFSEGGEVIVPASGESSEDISRASVVDAKGILLGGDLNIIKVNQDTVDSVFLALTISNGSQQRELIKRAQGKSVVHLRNNDLEKVILTFPSIEEQRAIGAFFANIDDLIASQQDKIAELETLKKKLLQNMFV
ncbi:restriction endonuclease subunit S [Streptococcus pluranimalium]|uniref:restriction endonuclease subunit S n=1 Tax=Streptococcus pluranimalium TaxID=82348 RepID=UPI00313974AD